MNIVLDTNVIVSGFLNPNGAPGRIVQMVSSGSLSLCFDARIISEYQKVLHRSKFDFEAIEVVAFLEQVQAYGRITAVEPLRVHLPDVHDEPFLEVAISAHIDFLVTGNMKHYPSHARQGIIVLSPQDFLAGYHKKK